MKCDELKSLWVYSRDIEENCDEEFVNFAKENGYEELVEKKEVIEAIAELKAENRRLKRALWLARAMRAEAQWNRQLRDAGIAFAIGENKSWDSWNKKQKKWQGVERKCRAKAEEYR